MSEQFYVLQVGEVGPPVLKAVLTEDELRTTAVGFLEDLNTTHMYVFRGERWHITSAPHRWLVSPAGRALPLFKPLLVGPIVEDGCVIEGKVEASSDARRRGCDTPPPDLSLPGAREGANPGVFDGIIS